MELRDVSLYKVDLKHFYLKRLTFDKKQKMLKKARKNSS
jgi:hypothetical protein